MDYTKDAVLIREGMKSFNDDDDDPIVIDDNRDNSHAGGGGGAPIDHQTFDSFSFATLMNGSEFIQRKMMKMAGAGAESKNMSGSGGVLEGDQFADFNDTMDYIPYSMRPETYIVPVLFAIIFIIGVIGNGTLIVIFMKHRSMRNVPNMFIVSLAIGDLLLILFCVPFTSTVYTVDSWPYGLIVCKFSEFVKDLSVGVSVFTLTALSADRYFAIVDPMRKLTGRRATRITIISIIGIWILSILVALPSALYSYIRVFSEYEEGEEGEEGEGEDAGSGEGEVDGDAEGRTFQVCYPYPTEFGPTYAQGMVMFHFLVYYAIPLIFIATFYIIMARHLVLSTRNMPGEAQGQLKQIQARKKVAKMILSFVVIFAICFFPHHLFLLWFYFYPDSENSFNAFWNICRIVGFCLSFMNSCINPITLYCVSGTFRKQFNDHLFCCFCNNSGNRPSRGGRMSGGGTLAGGGGGHGGGLCAACVSLSGNNGQLHGNDSRYGNGSLGRGGNGRLPRGSTWEYSDRMMSKRKSTWETQTTVVNHLVLNMTGNANIHVNLCSEHEHIALRNMSGVAHPSNRKLTTVAAVGDQGTATIITSQLQEKLDGGSAHNHNHNPHHQNEDGSSEQAGLLCKENGGGKCELQGHSHGRKDSGGSLFCRSRCVNINKSNKDACSRDETIREAEIDPGPHHHLKKNLNYPSLIEEEREQESGNRSSQVSPNKSYSEKVGEIFSRISGKYSGSGSNSPGKFFSKNSISGGGGSGVSETSSSSSRRSPTKVGPATPPAGQPSQLYEMDDGGHNSPQINFNNNNNYSSGNNDGSSPGNREKQQAPPQDESDMDEYTTVTGYITVPESVPLKANLNGARKVIICYI